MSSSITSNKLMLHSSFNKTVEELNKINIKLPKSTSNVNLDFQNFNFPPSGELVTPIHEISAINLDAKNGEKKVNDDRILAAYDESINKFSSLGGTAFLMSHSLVVVEKMDFVPLNLLTFYFYTRSKEITSKSRFIKHSTDPEMDSKKDYIKDKIELLTNNCPTIMIHAINKFLSKDIMPIFFVKNSSSNLVTDNISGLCGKYNSDMHWAYKFLKKGQRTNFFKYVDKDHPDNAKIFCYLKAFNLSPQRVEFHINTFLKYQDEMDAIMDLVYYLLLVQKKSTN